MLDHETLLKDIYEFVSRRFEIGKDIVPLSVLIKGNEIRILYFTGSFTNPNDVLDIILEQAEKTDSEAFIFSAIMMTKIEKRYENDFTEDLDYQEALVAQYNTKTSFKSTIIMGPIKTSPTGMRYIQQSNILRNVELLDSPLTKR